MEHNWGDVAREGAELLSRYVRIDTSNPPGNEEPAAELLAAALQEHGLSPSLYIPAAGRANLLARAPGRGGGRPLILLHHMDVCPADPTAWHHPPFSGEITQGWVWGRGTLESKALGVMQLLGLSCLLAECPALQRDLIYLAVCDGSTAWQLGSRWMLAHQPQLAEAEYVWTHGGWGLIDVFCPQPVMGVAVAEKRLMWLRLIARGEEGHGSLPGSGTAPEVLLEALARLRRLPVLARATPPVRATFQALRGTLPWPALWLQEHSDAWLPGLLTRPGMLRQPLVAAMLRDTLTVTSLSAGLRADLVPASAQATVDVRLLPDQDPQAFIRKVEQIIDDERVEINVLHYPDPVPPIPLPDPLFDALAATAKDLVPDGLVAPILTPVSSDAHLFASAGARCFGLTPALLDPYELTLLHGVDERISLENIALGTRYVYEVLRRFCT